MAAGASVRSALKRRIPGRDSRYALGGGGSGARGGVAGAFGAYGGIDAATTVAVIGGTVTVMASVGSDAQPMGAGQWSGRGASLHDCEWCDPASAMW